MDNIINFVSRPAVTTYTRWVGDNKAELESHYSAVFGEPVSFTVNGSGALVLPETPHVANVETVPEGHWFASGTAGTISNEAFESDALPVIQAVTGTGPFKYGISED